MRPRLVEFVRRRGRWLTGAALLALVPKCLLCLAAYAGLGAVVGLGGRELCGPAFPPALAWPEGLAVSGLTLGLVRLIAARRVRPDTVILSSGQMGPAGREGKV